MKKTRKKTKKCPLRWRGRKVVHSKGGCHVRLKSGRKKRVKKVRK